MDRRCNFSCYLRLADMFLQMNQLSFQGRETNRVPGVSHHGKCFGKCSNQSFIKYCRGFEPAAPHQSIDLSLALQHLVETVTSCFQQSQGHLSPSPDVLELSTLKSATRCRVLMNSSSPSGRENLNASKDLLTQMLLLRFETGENDVSFKLQPSIKSTTENLSQQS